MTDANHWDLTPDDFAAFFRGVHDQEPFPWQQRLTAQVLHEGRWPEVIDLPTGSGKTAVLDTAVFALAVRPEVFPRRIVFVIDRRIVVDQVCNRALRIRDRIAAVRTPILRLVGERLGALTDGEEPLGVAALRGGIPIDRDWTHRPDQPWVMVSTVDQFGSRLLFRGYGVTPGMRPIHAALARNDCLVILDEVHLSVPFAETLAQVAALDRGTLPRRFGVVEMSATPSGRQSKRFVLDPVADLDGCPELRRRVEARKEAQLVTVRDVDALPGSVSKITSRIAASEPDDRVRSVGVVVNRVRTARETWRMLAADGHAAFLVTGRMRPLDRAAALEKIAPAVDPERERETDALTVVVATQAIEVGADFDFDALITECAAVDSLRQRFGRLDRRGAGCARTGEAARAWIIGPRSTVAARKPDPIYGESVRVTWEELVRRAGPPAKVPIDVGPRALRDFPDAARAPRAHAPLLLNTHLEAWTQTSPEPIVQPDVDWFLHGIDRPAAADVSIVWRWDRSSETLRLVPPRQAEFLQVPIGAAKTWLCGGREVDTADVDPAGAEEDSPASSDADTNADWVRWEGFDKAPERVEIDAIRPGDILVVDPQRGGLTAGTWDPTATEPIADMGDAAQMAHVGRTGGRATLRLDPRLPGMGSVPLPTQEAAADVPVQERISQWLRAANGTLDEVASAAGRLLAAGFDAAPVGLDGVGGGYYVLTERHPRTQRPVVEVATMDGSDESGSLIGTGVTLSNHLEGVADRAGSIAQRLGLTAGLGRDVRLAGRLHDIGKVDRRFQARLMGDDPVALEMRREPLAKSLPGVHGGNRYPSGMRHEMASVALAASNPDVLRAAHDRDLVLHLIATHHGWARPLPPVIEDPEPHTLKFLFDGHAMTVDSGLAESPLALDLADRFWRLVERYGHHGLAWLETILRLADHQQSAAEAER